MKRDTDVSLEGLFDTRHPPSPAAKILGMILGVVLVVCIAVAAVAGTIAFVTWLL